MQPSSYRQPLPAAPNLLRYVMITDKELESIATGLGLTMMALIIVAAPGLVALIFQVYHFLKVNAGKSANVAETVPRSRKASVST